MENTAYWITEFVTFFESAQAVAKTDKCGVCIVMETSSWTCVSRKKKSKKFLSNSHILWIYGLGGPYSEIYCFAFAAMDVLWARDRGRQQKQP